MDAACGHGSFKSKHIMTTDGDTWDYDTWWHIGVTYGVTHGPLRSDTLELQFSLLLSIRNNGNCPGRHFAQPRVAFRADRANENGARVPSTLSLPGLTRQSIHLRKDFLRRRWMRGVISAFTRVFDALLPAHDELTTSADITPSCTIAFPFRRAFARGVIHFASLTPNRGVGGAPRNVRVLSGTPVGPAHDAAGQAPSEAPCVL